MSEVICYVMDGCGLSKWLTEYVNKRNMTHFKLVNIESDPLQIMQGNVKATPTIIVKDNDKTLATFVGFSPNTIHEVEEFIKKV